MLYKTRGKVTTFFSNNNDINKIFHFTDKKKNKKCHNGGFRFLKFLKTELFVNFCLQNVKNNLQQNEYFNNYSITLP